MARERVPHAVAAAVLERADRYCECCGRPGDPLVIHHRRLRSQGGKHTEANCIAVHPKCHEWIHLHPGDAYALGLLLEAGDRDSKPVQLSAVY